MSSDACFATPVWRADQLGKPIPDSPHAVSMALPRWQDVVDYEEKTPAIQEFVKTGYPGLSCTRWCGSWPGALGGTEPVCRFRPRPRRGSRPRT
jgi:hypothetical protein